MSGKTEALVFALTMCGTLVDETESESNTERRNR